MERNKLAVFAKTRTKEKRGGKQGKRGREKPRGTAPKIIPNREIEERTRKKGNKS